MKNVKTPDECADMEEIRAQVNALDREIVRLLGRRLSYVHGAVRFKPDAQSVTNPDHWDRFYAQRRAWGAEEGYDPTVIEDVYRRLYDFTIKVQLAMQRDQQKG